MPDNVGEVKNNGLKINAAQSETTVTLGEAMSTIADIAGIITLPLAIIQLFQILRPKTDPVIASLQIVANLLEAALHFQVVNDVEEHQFHIKDIINPAETSWATLNEVNFDTHSALVTLDTVQHDTLGSLHALSDPIYWYRPYYDTLDFDDGWFHQVIPSDIIHRLGPSLPEVFDYRLVLPSFLNAVYIRCSVILALRTLRPDVVTDAIFKNIQNQELQPMAQALGENYDKVVAGFVMGRVPDSSSRLDLNAWEHAGRVIGVVDSYSGSGIVDPAVEVDWSFDSVGFPVWNDDFDRIVFPVRYQLGVLRRWKTLYSNTGLHGVWHALQALRIIGGKREQAEAFDKRAAWSLRETYGVLGTVLQSTPPPPGSKIRASDIFRRLYKAAKLPFPDPTTFLPNQLSWRRALLAVPY